ncbi:unnamed protein product [Mytilus edulis]|uniref:G-patch domain-containing protein n=1 Tax=Mytilus edulis TaxID=6550 RepID=A0A8S3QYN5_MYTED|nr:unnamed protein product [Mytilus edulis]
MEWMKGEYSKLISFVSASSDDKSRKRKTENRKVNRNLEGTEVKNFYEEIINEESSASVKSDEIDTIREKLCPEKRRKAKSCSKTQANRSNITQIDINRYLRYAQEGNLRQLKVQILKGVPLDSHDRYGWSALMCAAHSGQLDIVKYLLSAGLKTDVVDRHNKSASDIARSAGFTNISKFIETWKPGSNQVNFPTEKRKDSCESFYCDICKQKFTESSVKNHESSMRLQDYVKSGWDGKEGLGSEGQGQRYPVKTVLKQDRKCLGSEKGEKAKITHFNANDKMAITKNPERKLSKRGLSRKDQKQKLKKQKHAAGKRKHESTKSKASASGGANTSNNSSVKGKKPAKKVRKGSLTIQDIEEYDEGNNYDEGEENPHDDGENVDNESEPPAKKQNKDDNRFSSMSKRCKVQEICDVKIDEVLANNVNELFRNGMNEEQYSDLTKDENNARPENCEGLSIVRINQLMWNVISPGAQSADKKITIS